MSQRVEPRLIPASAGQTPCRAGSTPATTAHPRECGADGKGVINALGGPGSSPRVRGRHRVVNHQLAVFGLIPASAGQTACSCDADRPCSGSSPRVRGRPSKPSSPLKQATAHPRECGADSSEHSAEVSGSGSSPRVRGRPEQVVRDCAPEGLIPASAGQTAWRRSEVRRRRAHPRECGADTYKQGKHIYRLGSSPRVRGRQHFPADCDPPGGLIPASAGQTACPPPFP